MESLQAVLDNFAKEHPELREEASVVLGGAVGKLLGGDIETGEAVAWVGTKFNYLTHKSEQEYQKKIDEAGSNEDEAKYYRERAKIQGTIANEKLKEYLDSHPEIGVQVQGEELNMIYLEEDFSIGATSVPLNILCSIEESAKMETTQIMGKDYYDYKGIDSFNGISSMLNWGIAENANLPWSLVQEQKDVPAWARRLGKYAIVGSAVNGAVNISRDFRDYSGKDRYLAVAYDVSGAIVGVGIGVGVTRTGGIKASVSLGVNEIIDYIAIVGKYKSLKTDREKEYEKRVAEFVGRKK